MGTTAIAVDQHCTKLNAKYHIKGFLDRNLVLYYDCLCKWVSSELHVLQDQIRQWMRRNVNLKPIYYIPLNIKTVGQMYGSVVFLLTHYTTIGKIVGTEKHPSADKKSINFLRISHPWKGIR